MSKQRFSNIIIQVPQQLKSDFQTVCREEELTMSRFIRLFMKSAIEKQFVFDSGLKLNSRRANAS